VCEKYVSDLQVAGAAMLSIVRRIYRLFSKPQISFLQFFIALQLAKIDCHSWRRALKLKYLINAVEFLCSVKKAAISHTQKRIPHKQMM